MRLLRRVLTLCLLPGLLWYLLIPALMTASAPTSTQQMVTAQGTTIVQLQPDTPGEAAIVAIMYAGTASQLADETHSAHIAEHMVFQKHAAGQPSLTDRVAAWGGSLNGHAELDFSAFQITVPESHTLDALQQLITALFVTDYDPGVYQRERDGYLRVELRGMTHDYPTALYNAFRQQVFQGSPYAEDLFGVDITKVPLSTVAAWQQREYGADRLVLVVNSSIPWERVISTLGQALADSPLAGPAPFNQSVRLNPPLDTTVNIPGMADNLAMIGLAVNQVAATDQANLEMVLRMLQAEMRYSGVRETESLTDANWLNWQRSASGYLQLAFKFQTPMPGRDPVKDLKAAFYSNVQRLAQGDFGPRDLQQLLRYLGEPQPPSGYLPGDPQPAAMEAALPYIPGAFAADGQVYLEMDQQELLQILQSTAVKYLRNAKLTFLSVDGNVPVSLIGLLVLFSTLILMAGLTISVVLRLKKRNLSFRVFLSLLSVTAKSAFRPRRKAGSEDDKVGRGLLQFVMIILVLFVAFWLAGILARVCLQIGQPELLFMLATTTLCLLLVFSGGYLLLSVFLWSIDNERLIALPITSGQIVLARLSIAAAGQYPISLLFLIPPLLKYLAYMGSGGPAIWLTTFLVALVLPIFTLTLVAIPIVLTMRFVTDKLRERLLAVGSLVLSLGSLLFYMQRGLSTNQANLENMLMLQLQLRQADLMTIIGRVFPPALWAGRAIAYAGSWRGTLNLAGLAVAAIACIYTLYRLSLRSFLGSVATGSRVRQSRPKRGTWNLSTPLLSLFGREWKLFWRNPALVTATLPNALLPMVCLYPLLRTGGTEQSLWAMAQLVQGESGNSLIPALVAGALALMLGINSKIALVSFSKDGPRFYFSKMIPVDYGTQVKAKLVLNLAVNGVCLLPLFLVGAIWLHLGLTTLFAALLLSIVALVFTCITCMSHDLAEPRLDWDNLQVLLRRGIGLEAFISTGLILVLTVVFCYLMIRKGWSITLCYLVVLAIYSLLAWGSYQSLLERADRLYEAIEM